MLPSTKEIVNDDHDQLTSIIITIGAQNVCPVWSTPVAHLQSKLMPRLVMVTHWLPIQYGLVSLDQTKLCPFLSPVIMPRLVLG